MAIESRIEADLSGQNTSSQSRIEQILNGEQITPRSRIEQLLQEYNPEDPGAYHKVECTKAQYDNMPSHSSDTIYVVTYPDQSVHFYLGDTEIAGNPTLIEKSITTNGIYDAEDDSADGYSIVEVDVEGLPSDIEALEYIKSTGNSVILTDIVPNYNWDVFFTLKMENFVSTGAYEILGINYPTEHFLMTFPWYPGYNTIDYLAWAGFTPSSGDTYGIMGKISIQDEANKQNTAIMRRDSGGCIFGKHNYTMTNRTDDATPTHPIVISGVDEGGTIYPYSRGELTIYGIRIFNEYSVLIHNFIPAQNKTTNRAGLYDLVDGVFYPSATGYTDFIKGPKAKGIPQVDATLTTKAITTNGAYNASSDNADGYSAITVNVPVNMEIVPYGTLVPNTYIASGSGEERSYNGCSATGYIEIDPDNYYYVFTGKFTAQYGDDWDPTTNAYYDANKTYISGFSNNAGSGAPSDRDNYFHEFPSTAKYIRISQEASVFSDYKSFIARIRKSYINPNA